MIESDLSALSQRITELENNNLLNKPVLNLNELSKYIGISKSHIYKLTMKGEIPFYKQCKHLYFNRLEIESWLQQNRFDVVNTDIQAANYCLTNKRRG